MRPCVTLRTGRLAKGKEVIVQYIGVSHVFTDELLF